MTVGTGSRLAPWVARYLTAVQPTASGLPHRLVFWAGPALFTAVALVLIVLQLNGSSTGMHHLFFGVGPDPDLIAGHPRAIRSDQWLVNEGWTASQAVNGYPAVNPTFPGGLDMAVLQELPTWEWSALLRPHTWGYLLFGLDVGAAWFWWVPAVALCSAAYLLMVTFVPRRPVAALLVGGSMYFIPLLQWWYGPNLIWPIAWALLLVTAIVWAMREPRLGVRIAWAAVVGYLATTTAVGLYVPFIVPCIAVALFVALGVVLDGIRSLGLRPALVRLVPILIAGGVAGAVLALWVLSHADTIQAINSTVYPGARTIPSGMLSTLDPRLVDVLSAPFGAPWSDNSEGTIFGLNASGASTVPVVGLLLLPGLVVLSVRRWRRERRVDATVVATVGILVFLVIYQVVPGLEVIGRFLLFDRVPTTRFRVVLALAIPLVMALVFREVDRAPRRRFDWVPWMSGLLALGSVLWVLRAIVLSDPWVLALIPLWWLSCAALVAAVTLAFLPKAAPAAAASVLILMVTVGGGANPLYRGVYELTGTDIAAQMREADPARDAAWVGVGGAESMALIMQTGSHGYSGVQTYPPGQMWNDIDPDGEHEEIWNRFAHVRWQWGAEGEPHPKLYTEDVILTDFDACSDFAQEHVDLVLSDSAADGGCVRELAAVAEGETRFWIYEIVPAPRADG